MSLEQLLFIALFVLVPLVRALAERRNKQREAEAEELFETLASAEVPRDTGFDPPAWPAPAFPPPAPTPATAPPVRQPLLTSPLPPETEAMPRPLPSPARSLRTARARTLAAVPRDRAELRRAFLLIEIFGPPRGLTPRDR